MTRVLRTALALGLLPLVALGCDPAVSDTEAGPALAQPSVVAAPTTLTGLATPESALYDPVADVYYVSNVGDPLGGGGFISRIDPDATGDVSDDPGYVWIDGLASPFGLALDGDALYVVDRDGLNVFEIDRTTGNAAPTGFVALGAPGSLLNDVCVATSGPDRGAVYVTDTGLDLATSAGTGTDAVYRIADGEVTTFVDDGAEEGPNGCLTHGANVLWTTFKSNTVYRTNPSGRQKTLATLPTGGLDSVVRAGGSYFVSSWNADPADPPTGVIYVMSLGGSRVTPLLEGVFTPGDLGYDTTRDRVLVPSVFGNELVIVPVG